jgi:hypothetical protein
LTADDAIGADSWRPLSLRAVEELLAEMAAPWWIAGGWAIDLFLGRQTRPHGDVDVAVLRADQAVLAESLAGWDLHVAAEGRLTPWTPSDWLEGGRRHQLWCRQGPDQPWSLEILLEEGDRFTWRFRRDPRVTLPLEHFGRRAEGGMPYVAPEVALLFKASTPEAPRNRADFEAALPAMKISPRTWLNQALLLTAPGHPWAARLSA